MVSLTTSSKRDMCAPFCFGPRSTKHSRRAENSCAWQGGEFFFFFFLLVQLGIALVDPLPGSKFPDDLKITIGVQPESGRLSEVVYPATRDDSRGQAEYKVLAEFDRDEFWKVRLAITSAQGNGEALSRVEATPPGFGRWDLLLYLLPFLAIAFLWFRGMARTRNRRNKRLQVA